MRKSVGFHEYRFLLIIIILSCVVSCTRSKEYYKKNPEEMSKMLSKCNEELSKYFKDENCKNAAKAKVELTLGL